MHLIPQIAEGTEAEKRNPGRKSHWEFVAKAELEPRPPPPTPKPCPHAPASMRRFTGCEEVRGLFQGVSAVTYPETHTLTKAPSTSGPQSQVPQAKQAESKAFSPQYTYSTPSRLPRSQLPTRFSCCRGRCLGRYCRCPLLAKPNITGQSALPFTDSGAVSRGLKPVHGYGAEVEQFSTWRGRKMLHETLSCSCSVETMAIRTAPTRS